MPFNPALPAANTPLSSAVMRAQLTALNGGINTAVANSSNNTNSVSTLGISADVNYDPAQLQDVINKLDELINTARRV